ncbi:MAG: putative drug exporter of the superfamily [Frankiales bacterium]|jgi:RND superfamily putative drug exporter|nr:putative drug exporter of the superfamily [Frankiales bacterium]
MATVTQADMFTRLGAFCYRRRRLVALAWAVLVIAGIALGSSVFGRLADDTTSSSESGRGFDLLDRHATAGDSVVAIVDKVPVDSATTKRAVADAAADIRAIPNVANVLSAYDAGGDHLRARDNQASLIVVTLAPLHDDALGPKVAHTVRDRMRAIPVGDIRVGGEALLWEEFQQGAERDAIRGEAVAFPIALVALLLVFGGLAAAALPLISALVAIGGSLLLLLAASFVTDIAVYAVNTVTMLGLGLAIDYSLLAVYRFREERAAGLDVPHAVERTVATAGRTVAYSAVTVMASFGGLMVLNDPLFRSLAAGGIGVIVVAMLAALTLTPALLGIWGHRIKPRATSDHGAFATLARWVHRRPVPVVIVVAAALLAAGIPFLHANYRQGGPEALPKGSEVRQVAETLTTRFPDQQVLPLLVIAPVSPTDPRLLKYADQLRVRQGVTAVTAEQDLDGQIAALRVYPIGDSQGSAAQSLVRDLRADEPGFPTYVAGSAAYLVDFKHNIARGLPWALLLICMATLILLFLMTGSVLVPIKALVMNFLSLGATFGVLVWVFQDGHLVGLIGGSASGGLETVVPVLVFVFAFGLSMDYEVFLISRVRELVDQGLPNDVAVERALQRSGRIITSAAALIVIVFIGFATAPSPTVKQMGVALTTAVVVDVTLVRCLLVPATMTLLGDLNWWAPRPLRRLHARFGLQEPAAASGAPKPAREPADTKGL